MSARTAAAALCFAIFFATAPARAVQDGAPEIRPAAVWEWIAGAWNALVAAVEEPPAPPRDDGVTLPGRDEGWLIDPNG
jgi:hypothetical protein